MREASPCDRLALPPWRGVATLPPGREGRRLGYAIKVAKPPAGVDDQARHPIARGDSRHLTRHLTRSLTRALEHAYAGGRTRSCAYAHTRVPGAPPPTPSRVAHILIPPPLGKIRVTQKLSPTSCISCFYSRIGTLSAHESASCSIRPLVFVYGFQPVQPHHPPPRSENRSGAEQCAGFAQHHHLPAG